MRDLFGDDRPNYANAKFPELRPFQKSTHEALRAGIKAGHKNQLVMAPTGGGKTLLAMNVIHEALLKGRRAMFVADRRTLINQTSQVADSLGLGAHGVLMADHWRYKPDMPFQIASAQTLARREWPDVDVIVVDECHVQLSVWAEHIPTCRAAVVGLSATPFSPGLGKLFSNLINATTMHDLTESGVLVPLRVLTCKRADMTGAATAGGEWTDLAAQERGMEIVGNVVQEWTQHGENRKTICFGSTIKHCEELCKSFNEVGVMASMFTSETSEAERAQILAEFKKPDSSIRVLVSVEALSKGFDQKDVSCVIDCRPLRKSLSTFIQMVGRGLRASPDTGKKDCVARGTLILTDRGEVEIQNLTRSHRVWDGEHFVKHGGAVCRGVQAVIEYDGLVATPDHEVWTDDGWTRFEEAARRRLRIARTGFGGHPIRLADDHLAQYQGERVRSLRGGSVRALLGAALRAIPQHPQALGYGSMPALQLAQADLRAEVAVPPLSSAIGSVHQSEGALLRTLRRAWDRVQVFFGKRSCTLDCGESWADGGSPLNASGQDRQRWALRTWESALGVASAESEQHARIRRPSSLHCIPQAAPGHQVCGCDARQSDQAWTHGPANHRSMGNAVMQAKREVWDVLNAGPLQRFTANGRLVHNCVLLDHSGNVIRFADDFSKVFYEGLDELDAGEKLDKEIRRDEDKDKEPKACPACGFKPMGRRCIACGHEPKSLALVEHVPGHMQEVCIGKKKLADDHRHLYEQVCTYARSHGNPETAKKRAAHLFREFVGQWPDGYHFERTPNVEITRNVLNRIKARNIAFARAKQAGHQGAAA